MNERVGKPYQEYFLVASGNQAMAKAGNLKGTGATVNIASGQLGIVSADAGNATKGFNDFLTGAETASTVPVVQFVQGTPAATDNANAYGWPSRDNGVVRSCKVFAKDIVSIAARHYQIPTHSSLLLSAMSEPADDSNYGIYVIQRSKRLGRSHRNEKISSAVFPTGTMTATVKKDWVLQNLLHRLNLNSKRILGNEDFIALALNLGGSANGTPLGTVALGDVIPVMVYEGQTYNIVANAALIQTIYRWITDNSAISASTTIETINLATAGSKVAATGTITITDYTLLSTDTVSVNATDLVEGTDFDAETSNDVTATNLAAVIDAISGVNATASGAVVTVTATTAGAAGNAIAMTYTAGTGTGLTLSGATLTGGDETNVDGVMIVGLAHDLPELHDGLPNDMVDVGKSQFSHAFANDPLLAYSKACGAREPLQNPRFLLKRYDERAFAQTGLTSLNGPADTLLQAKKYIDASLNGYTMITIDAVTKDKAMDQQYRVNIFVPGTDDRSSATGASGVTVTTNAANTESDLNSILSTWIDNISGLEYLGQAVSGTCCPA